MGRSNPCILRSNCEVICVLLWYCLSERDFIKRVFVGHCFRILYLWIEIRWKILLCSVFGR